MKKVSIKDVEQIAWEAVCWSRDAYELEKLGKRGNFKSRFDKWIKQRIKLSLTTPSNEN